MKPEVCVVGLGYIGLPTALMLAAHGVRVLGVDHNSELVATLSAGEVTFKEAGLERLFEEAIQRGIEFATSCVPAETYVVAVPTPYVKPTKKIDPTYVVQAVRQIIGICPHGATVIIESTVSPGTIDKSVRPLIESCGLRVGQDVHLVHAPERIIPGNMIYELKKNSRTIGVDDPRVGHKVSKLYAKFCEGSIVVTDIRTAEMTKVVENTYRDINIAFANELLKICSDDGLDVYEIIRIANMHPRVNILQPGPGVGGHCISVDPWFLVGDYPGLANIILAARKINDSMPEFVLARIHEIMREKNIDDISRVGLYGLAYKENVDDTRESPTLQLLDAMNSHLARELITYDPFVKNDVTRFQYHNLDEFLSAVDFVVIMTAHDEIRAHATKLKDKVVLDTRNVSELPDAYKLCR